MGFLVPLFALGLLILVFAGLWKIFEKAGEPGWAAIVPIYNIVILLKIAGKPLWWLILIIIPLVNLIVIFIVYIDLAKRFGKDALYGVGLVLLGIIFIPMLGFSDATYTGTKSDF